MKDCPLESLDIAGTVLNNIEFTKNMPLRRLNISYTDVSDVTPLSGMRKLVELNLSYTRVADISILQGMNIKRLDVSGTDIVDLSCVRTMPLESLSVRRTKVTDLRFLEGMKLSWLAVDHNFPSNGLPQFKGDVIRVYDQ